MLNRSPMPGVLLDGVDLLGDRLGLAGEPGLLGAQLGDLQQPQVGRDAVAGAHPDDVARHQVGRLHLDPVAVASGLRGQRQHRAQARQGPLGAPSWAKPMTALATATATMTPTSTHSPRIALSSAATSRT
jgi:hypothetical protein